MTHQIGCQFPQTSRVIVREAEFDRHIAAFDKTSFSQPFAKCGNNSYAQFGHTRVEEPDHRHRGLLGTCRQRPCHRAADERDQLPPFHSITSICSSTVINDQKMLPSNHPGNARARVAPNIARRDICGPRRSPRPGGGSGVSRRSGRGNPARNMAEYHRVAAAPADGPSVMSSR